VDDWKFFHTAEIWLTENKDGKKSPKFKGCDGATVLYLTIKALSKKKKIKENSLYTFMCYSNGGANLSLPLQAIMYFNKYNNSNKIIVNGEHYKIEYIDLNHR